MNDREYPEPETEVPSMAARDLYERIAAGERVPLLDVRDRDEFEAWHIDGPGVEAIQAPYVKFVSADVTGSAVDPIADAGLDEPVVVVCARGEASAHVAGMLREAGVEAANLADGMEGWARVYVSTAIPVEGATVRQYYRPSSGCLACLIHDGGEAAVVDPLRAFVDRYVGDAREAGVDLRYAVDTHVHADHFSGVRALADRTGAEAVLPAAAAARGVTDEVTTVADGDVLEVGSAEIEAIHTPGHTTGMTSFRVGDLLLTGDSLFLDGVARPDLERGEDGARELADTLYDSLQRILALPGDTRIAPGHVGPGARPGEDGAFTARLGDLRERLPLLGLDREAFAREVASDVPPRPANYEAIIDANLGRSEVADAEAFELELGPNNCAVS